MAQIVVVVFGLLLVGLGGLGAVSPARLLDSVRRIQTPAGLYLAAAVRIVLGVALILAAPDSRAPELARVFGIFVVLAGLVAPFFGLERFRGLLDWWADRGEGFVRAWGIVAGAIGVGLVWLVS